jgi:hypothetical protein
VSALRPDREEQAGTEHGEAEHEPAYVVADMAAVHRLQRVEQKMDQAAGCHDRQRSQPASEQRYAGDAKGSERRQHPLKAEGVDIWTPVAQEIGVPVEAAVIEI